jgi:hypothetical protein
MISFMDDYKLYNAAPDAAESVDLKDRTRQTLEDAAASGDTERLKLLEDLYGELSNELERDVGENSS